MIERPLFLAGERVATGDIHDVRAPHTGEVVTRCHRARPAAIQAAPTMRDLPAWRRSEILGRVADAIHDRREELARALALEAGKPLKAGRAEADRAVFTFRVAGEEARRIGGELMRLDWAPW